MPSLVVSAALAERLHGLIDLFAVDDQTGEVSGIFEYVLLPIAVCSAAAITLLRIWANKIRTRPLLAISVTVGTFLAATFYIVFLTLYPTIAFGGDTLYNIIVRAFFRIILFAPTLLVVGPIAVGCLIQARQGKTLLSSRMLYSTTILVLFLQYFWAAYILSG